MKTILQSTLLLLATVAIASAQVLHLKTDFDHYTPGAVATQSGTGPNNVIGTGGWQQSGNVDQATIITDPDRGQVLAGSRTAFPAAIYAPLTQNFAYHGSPGKSYLAFDFYKPLDTGSAVLTLADTTNQGQSFGIFMKAGANATLELNRINGARLTTSAAIATAAWYRLELEITPGVSGIAGTFNAYLTGPTGGRQLITPQDQSYNFNGLLSPNAFYIIPQGASNATVYLDNIIFQSGLSHFPGEAVPEPGAMALLAGVAFGAILWRRRSLGR